MSAMSNALEVEIRKHLLRTGSWTKPAALWVALHTADPTDAGTGSEVSGGGYARVQRDPGDANWTGASATDGISTNAAPVTFPAPSGANWGLVTHWSLWSAPTGGTMWVHAALTTPKTVNNGDPAPSFAAGALSLTFQ